MMTSKKIIVIALLIISLIGLSGCAAGTGFSGSVFVESQPTYRVLPLQGLIIRDINLNSFYLENSFSMESALKSELMMAGAQFGPNGVVLNGDVKIIKNGNYQICLAEMVVNVESFSPVRLYSTADVRVDCFRGRVLIYPQDYQQAARFIVQDFIRQMNH